MNGSPRGIALLIVLWVITALTVMAFSFTVMTRAESYGTMAFKEEREKKLLAEAGIERGIMEMVYRSVNRNQTMRLEGMEAWRPDGTSHAVDMGPGGHTVRIIDEAGKISLNGLTDSSAALLRRLLINRRLTSEQADTIVDSILDWRDADDLHRLSGAESDYYLSLAKPYRAANRDFESIEELILVRGVTPEILYGTDGTGGIIHLLTVYGKSGRISINAAPMEVLEALPGIDAAAVERVIAFRSSAEIRGDAAARELLGAAHSLTAPYISTEADASLFTVETSGYTDDPKKGYPIRATILLDRSHRYRTVYYKSPAEIRP
ncbi:MAG: type II secretion system minor pseudopilin [Syntrophales bacterium]